MDFFRRNKVKAADVRMVIVETAKATTPKRFLKTELGRVSYADTITLDDADLLPPDQEDDVRKSVAAQLGIEPGDVNLDGVYTTRSGAERRALRRTAERAEAKRKRRGRKAYLRSYRETFGGEPQPSRRERILADRAARAAKS